MIGVGWGLRRKKMLHSRHNLVKPGVWWTREKIHWLDWLLFDEQSHIVGSELVPLSHPVGIALAHRPQLAIEVNLKRVLRKGLITKIFLF